MKSFFFSRGRAFETLEIVRSESRRPTLSRVEPPCGDARRGSVKQCEQIPGDNKKFSFFALEHAWGKFQGGCELWQIYWQLPCPERERINFLILIENFRSPTTTELCRFSLGRARRRWPRWYRLGKVRYRDRGSFCVCATCDDGVINNSFDNLERISFEILLRVIAFTAQLGLCELFPLPSFRFS